MSFIEFEFPIINLKKVENVTMFVISFNYGNNAEIDNDRPLIFLNIFFKKMSSTF